MKPAVLNVLAYSFLFLLAVSCSKSSTNSGTPAKSKTVLLTQASWKLQSIGVDADKNGVAETDVTSQVQACQLDNIYTFKSDSTGISDEGATKCNTTDPQTKPFVWGFKNNQTVLTGNFGLTSSDATILSMTDTALTVTYDDNLGTSTTFHLLAVFKH